MGGLARNTTPLQNGQMHNNAHTEHIPFPTPVAILTKVGTAKSCGNTTLSYLDALDNVLFEQDEMVR